MNNHTDSSTTVERDFDQIQELRYNLFQSCSWLNNGTRQFLQPFGITPKQFSILGILADRAPESLSIQEVRDSLADKMSDASRLIDRLEKKGLLNKFPSDFDRRSNRVRITEKGEKLLKRINNGQDSLRQLISDRLEAREVAQLNDLLDRLK